MVIKTVGSAVYGVEAITITVEVNWMAAGFGSVIAGLADNGLKESMQRIESIFGLRSLYDGFACSFDVQLGKPDPAIEKLALHIAGDRPEECLYIDDQEALARTGRGVGLPACQHKTFEETKAFFRGYGGRIVKGAQLFSVPNSMTFLSHLLFQPIFETG